MSDSYCLCKLFFLIAGKNCYYNRFDVIVAIDGAS